MTPLSSSSNTDGLWRNSSSSAARPALGRARSLAVAAATARRVAVVDRDQYMFMFNRWPDAPDHELLRLVILFCLERDIDVVLEGNFKVETHRPLLDQLFAAHPDDNYLFYLDVSLEETLRRHGGRRAPISPEKMRELYPFTTPLHDPRERLIPEAASTEEAMRVVVEVAGL